MFFPRYNELVEGVKEKEAARKEDLARKVAEAQQEEAHREEQAKSLAYAFSAAMTAASSQGTGLLGMWLVCVLAGIALFGRGPVSFAATICPDRGCHVRCLPEG